jgi:hypothetical protein
MSDHHPSCFPVANPHPGYHFHAKCAAKAGAGDGAPAPLRSMLQSIEFGDRAGRDRLPPAPGIRIRAAQSAEQRHGASALIERRYAARGYRTTPLRQDDTVNKFTLTANDGDSTIGTLTVGFDSSDGLLADELFLNEIDALRAQGDEVCEFTKLALDTLVCSKRVLASLFHMAYIYAHRVKGFDTVLIEVNPRHVRYYQRMLGFQVQGPERLNRRVNAPAVLMALDLFHAREQIRRFGGSPEAAANERSLYPYFFGPSDEAAIVERLRRLPSPSHHPARAPTELAHRALPV